MQYKYTKNWREGLDIQNNLEDLDKFFKLGLNNITLFDGTASHVCVHVHSAFDSIISVTAHIEAFREASVIINTIGMLKHHLPNVPLLIEFVKEAMFVTNNSDLWSVACFATREYGISLNSEVLT